MKYTLGLFIICVIVIEVVVYWVVPGWLSSQSSDQTDKSADFVDMSGIWDAQKAYCDEYPNLAISNDCYKHIVIYGDYDCQQLEDHWECSKLGTLMQSQQ